ncbi:MAG: hypothetical protein ACOCT8_04355, partial [Actinomycetota bacterium]
RQGFGPALERAERARRADASGLELADALGAETLDALGWAGAPEDDPGPVLDRYREAGLDHLVLRVVATGDEPVDDVHATIRAFDRFTPARG